ncbi:MAG TPA: hypothetical protein VG297_03745 [Bryobacteraceae bacterium]|jgi:hypothetical protein|nr:hypothetical protein [Bryobacteraceae bacterium]
MCDYSLMMAPNRLAVEGEELVAHKFKCGSTGIVASRDFNNWARREPRTFRQWFRDGFSPVPEPTPVVCLPPGARLQLLGVPENLRAEVAPDLSEEVVFTQISAEANQHRDALFFANGFTVLLQRLPEGQRLRVLSLSSEDWAGERPQPEIVFAG